MASGHAAVIAESKNKEGVLTVKLGNLLPKQSATLKQTIVSQLEVVGGHYLFTLPACFYPDYKKHGVKNKSAYPYEFSYSVEIISQSVISNISVPENAQVSDNGTRNAIIVLCNNPGRTMDLYYRTSDMMVPSLQYARIPNSSDLVISASLVPTFDPV